MDQAPSSGFSLWEDQDVPLRQGIWGVSLQAKKFELSLELNLLIQNSIQQDYLPELYPIIPINIYVKLFGWGRIPPNRQKFTHFPHQKIPLDKFTSFAIKDVIPYPSNSNFHLITL